MQQNSKKNIEDIYGLTPMQEGMLFHTLYKDGSDAYIEQFIFEIGGDLDKDVFRKAWEYAVKRHAVLRTSFQWKGISKPVQVVSVSAELPWTYLDWGKLEANELESKFKQFLKQDRKIIFSMDQAPLMRCTLIRTGDQKFKFVWTYHHILLDGWSYPIIQSEIFKAYESFKENREPELPRPIPYKNYILWLNEKDKSPLKNFWESELKGFQSPTPMITNERAGEMNSDETDELVLKFSPELTTSIQTFARNNQLTLNTIFQGIWALILSEYRGENDVVFGATVSGRTSSLKGVESMVGLFINSLPVRVTIDSEHEIVSWFKKLQEAQIARDEYFYSSLVDIQGWSELPGATQLFENILVFENYPADKTSLTGKTALEILNIKAIERTSFPLTILISPGESLGITILYETAKFYKETIKGILSNFNTLLRSVSSGSHRKISELSLLTKEEETKILNDWNDTAHDFPKDKSIAELFEVAVKKYGDSIAVEFEGKTLTYDQLNEQSNKLANYLKKQGIGPDTKTGICIERSPDMLTAVLAVLKAGGAYVPLDQSYPSDRLKFMIEDTGIPVILTKKVNAEKIKSDNVKLVILDSEEEVNIIDKESASNPELTSGSSNLAYVLYTSGSTGKPKAVLMKQQSLVNLLHWQINGQNFESGLRVLQFTTLSFDVSFQEIFSTWLSGGTLVLISDKDRNDLRIILQMIREKKIQRIFLPFIALQEIAELFSGTKSKALSIKEVITAGEQLQITPAIINLFSHLKEFTFSNHYGPSEAHVVTSYTLNNDPGTWMKLPPIGKPIFNTQIHILNSNMKPVPVGVAGNLYIGGTCLSAGYQNRDELTVQKFIDNPFSNDKKFSVSKLYETGDMARYRPDGHIEYLGRRDSQIKLRGFRIELGEIETVLSEYPGMKSVSVIAGEVQPGQKRLMAYYVLSGKGEVSSDLLKNYLSSKLPEHMIPSDFIELKEMPLTPSGKINQLELPAPELKRTGKNNSYIVPSDPLELQLTKIWEKVLGVSQIGTRDNFFDLGGNSLLALRLFGYIEKLTGKSLALSILFDSPTIAEIAKILKNEGWTSPWKSLVPVKPGGSKLPFYCVPPAGGTALHFQSLVKYVPDDQPVYVLESIGLNGKDKPHTNLEEMSAHYIKEIRTLQPDGPYLLGGRCFGGRVVFEMAQQLVKQGQAVALLAIFDTWPPYVERRPEYIPKERDIKHFISRSAHHIMTGEFFTVARRYFSNKFIKTFWKIKNKGGHVFSSAKKRVYNEIMLVHFKAQDQYIAKKYPGKITLIECATFKPEYREGWKNLAGKGFETHTVPDTNHKSIVKEPKIREFAGKMNLVLEKTHQELEVQKKLNGRNLKQQVNQERTGSVFK